MAREQIFLDTSALVAAVLSDTDGARQLLKLSEANAITLWIGPTVLAQIDAVLSRKSPDSKPGLALLLDRADVQIGPLSDPDAQMRATPVVAYAADADIVAEALAARVDYLVSLDRQHLVGHIEARELPFLAGIPGDCLVWLRARWS